MDILLDMDGVLVNWMKGVLIAHNRPESVDDIKLWNPYVEWGMDDIYFWSKLKGREFWANLEPYDWTVDLFNGLKEFGDVTICTAPSKDKECIQGKLDWLEKHLNIGIGDFCAIKKKYLLANKNSILIDDYFVNIDRFNEAGGYGILFAQPWNDSIYNWRECLKKVELLT